MTDAAAPPAETKKTPKEQPWAIQMLHAMVADRVPERLGSDVVNLAFILIERQDILWGKPVGQYIGQLCKLCGFPSTNTERLRRARKALIDDGWLECEIPKNGERSQAYYKMVLKTTPADSVDGKQTNNDNPSESGLGEESDPSGTRLGEGLTPAKVVAAPHRIPSRHPSESRPPSDPSISDPSISDPKNNTPSIPPLPPKGGCDETENDEVLILEKTPKGKKQSSKTTNELPVIPQSLNTPTFLSAWSDWIQHRKEIKKPLKPTQSRRQLDQFAEWGEQRAINAIVHSITNGWQGIFEPASKPGFFDGITSAVDRLKKKAIDNSGSTFTGTPFGGVGWVDQPRRKPNAVPDPLCGQYDPDSASDSVKIPGF